MTQNGRLVTFWAGSPKQVTDTVKPTGLKGKLGIDAGTGAVASSTELLGLDGAPVILVGKSIGVDVNAAADALRIVSDADQNLRVLLSDRARGATGTTFVDAPLTPGGQAITATAYTNSNADPATGTGGSMRKVGSRTAVVDIVARARAGLRSSLGSSR